MPSRDKRVLNNIDSTYNTLVVGGGIVGAGVFRDLALHGVKTLLIDKKDFSSQTSRASSKMLHGGIRYLENFDFRLVWEALHEKNLWLKLTPHLVKEQRFYLPVFKDSLRPLWMIKIGLTLYDLLSSNQNTPHEVISAKKLKEVIPILSEDGLKGAGVYSDAVVDDLKLTLEVIYDALKEKNQTALNHVSIQKVIKTDQEGSLVEIKDELNGQVKKIKVENIVYCTGPFTDEILPKLGHSWKPKLLTSKGSHIWLNKSDLPLTTPVVMTDDKGRVIFVIPHGKRILVGTTEEKVSEDLFSPKASQKEIDYLLNSLKRYFPKFNLSSPIISSFSGIRPLIGLSGQDRGKTSREHRFYQPTHNTYVLVGGKYTTFRTMAQDVTRPIVLKAKKTYQSDISKKPLRQHSVVSPQDWETLNLEQLKEKVTKVIQQEQVRTVDDVMNRCMAWPDVDDNYSKLKAWIINQYPDL